MKCVYHKQDETYRVMQRGRLFYVQRSDGLQNTRESQAWQDLGKPKDSFAEAQAAMYVFKPLREKIS